MRLCYGVPKDIESWMSLVNRTRWNFPGLETQEKLDEHKATVVKFMGKRQAICVKDDKEITGIMLFSRGHNMICFLCVSPDHRRREVRSRLKTPGFGNLYADVQRHYETIRKYARKTERSLYSFGWLFDIARCLYTLRTGKIIAKTAAAEWAVENNLCPVPDALKIAVKVRRAPLEYMEEEHSMGDNRILDLSETLGETIQRFADVLEKELKEIQI